MMKISGRILGLWTILSFALIFAGCGDGTVPTVAGSGTAGFDVIAGSGSSGFELQVINDISISGRCQKVEGTTFCNPHVAPTGTDQPFSMTIQPVKQANLFCTLSVSEGCNATVTIAPLAGLPDGTVFILAVRYQASDHPNASKWQLPSEPVFIRSVADASRFEKTVSISVDAAGRVVDFAVLAYLTTGTETTAELAALRPDKRSPDVAFVVTDITVMPIILK